ncbi:hypothetical protein PR048_027974 [Dryococelus australis]|uniref:Uncharacterized protein n=1 Tax=Dryococelus australis TaxID=614101 RepID=A0ABQ9GI25_9NEOP|nr:hypothetical protein PR048_027974 [Dryococelus australis]
MKVLEGRLTTALEKTSREAKRTKWRTSVYAGEVKVKMDTVAKCKVEGEGRRDCSEKIRRHMRKPGRSRRESNPVRLGGRRSGQVLLCSTCGTSPFTLANCLIGELPPLRMPTRAVKRYGPASGVCFRWVEGVGGLYDHAYDHAFAADVMLEFVDPLAGRSLADITASLAKIGCRRRPPSRATAVQMQHSRTPIWGCDGGVGRVRQGGVTWQQNVATLFANHRLVVQLLLADSLANRGPLVACMHKVRSQSLGQPIREWLHPNQKNRNFRDFYDLYAKLHNPLYTRTSAVCSLAVAPVLPHIRQYGIRFVLLCKSSVGVEPSKPCLINSDPVARNFNLPRLHAGKLTGDGSAYKLNKSKRSQKKRVSINSLVTTITVVIVLSFLLYAFHGRGKREIPKETRRPAASSDTIHTCENPGVTRPWIDPGSPSWEASMPTAQQVRPLGPQDPDIHSSSQFSVCKATTKVEMERPVRMLGRGKPRENPPTSGIIRHDSEYMDNYRCLADSGGTNMMPPGRRRKKLPRWRHTDIQDGSQQQTISGWRERNRLEGMKEQEAPCWDDRAGKWKTLGTRRCGMIEHEVTSKMTVYWLPRWLP